jgi:hypothetical protein
VASLRRQWKDVIREVKAARPMASKAFLDTEVDLDGDTVVVEFPSDRKTPMRAASDPDVTALLRDCIRKVTGASVAVRFQLGRGVVRPEGEDAADDPPAVAEPLDVERMLIDGLGAQVVVEDVTDE